VFTERGGVGFGLQSSIVKRVSNLYDTYFEGGKDHRLERVSAVDLPYFEGDYWPGVAEVMLKTIDEEKKAAATGTKKAQTKKGSRSKMSKGKIANVGGATTDEQLMTKLGDAISGAACNKEDLMVVHLQHVCCICRTCIHNGTRYYSDSPFGSGSERRFEGIKLDSSTSNGGMSGFELCDNCYQVRQSSGQPHPLAAGLRTDAIA
jgi:E1A/CREB-binding protein